MGRGQSEEMMWVAMVIDKGAEVSGKGDKEAAVGGQG